MTTLLLVTASPLYLRLTSNSPVCSLSYIALCGDAHLIRPEWRERKREEEEKEEEELDG